MNASFYTAAVGASQHQNRLNVHSNNIANVNNHGFKAEKATFAALMYGNLQGIEGAELPRGTGTRIILTDTDFSGGSQTETRRDYDYSILGDGFFGLRDPISGETSYTRKGSFSLAGFQRPSATGELEQVYMLSDGFGRFVLNRDGLPLEVPENTNPADLPIAVYSFENTNGMQPIGSNRYLPVDKNGAPQLLEDATTVQQGFLEGSNTELAVEFTKLIEAQRSYSYALKMIQTSDEVETTINGLRG